MLLDIRSFFFNVCQGHTEFQSLFLPLLSSENSVSIHIDDKAVRTKIRLVVDSEQIPRGTVLDFSFKFKVYLSSYYLLTGSQSVFCLSRISPKSFCLSFENIVEDTVKSLVTAALMSTGSRVPG